jgi:adenylate kinase family enzyme
MALPQRILVKGGSGAGKSTLARALAERHALPYVELDALHHGPHWQPTPAALFRELVEARIHHTCGWVVDGNYDVKLGDMLIARADVIVWLDLPLALKLARLARRTASRWARDEALWNGNRESLRTAFWGGDSLFVWAVRSHFSQQREWPVAPWCQRAIRLRSPAEVEHWLGSQ